MSSEICRTCGVNLVNQDQPWARLVSWPKMLDCGTFTIPGGWSNMPTADELCLRCRDQL